MANTYTAQPVDANGRQVSTSVVPNIGYVSQQLDNFVGVDAVSNAPYAAQIVTFGGTQTKAVAAGTATDTVIKATPGRLCKVLITTLGSNALVIWDNASGHTGTIIGYIAASAVAGTIADFQMPAVNGITVQGNASNPAFTLSYS